MNPGIADQVILGVPYGEIHLGFLGHILEIVFSQLPGNRKSKLSIYRLLGSAWCSFQVLPHLVYLQGT